MELRHLRYFAAVAREMSFRRAAEQLNMTQPPLSQQIKQLEAELGFELFHRHGRTISLTAAGQVFLAETHRVLSLVDVAVRRGQQAARGETGQIHIGFVQSAAYRLLPGILKSFRRQFPRVDIRLSSMTSNEQLQALQEAQIDVGFCRLSGADARSDTGLQVETVSWEPLCAVLPHKHRLAQQPNLTVADLADERLILFPRHLGKALFSHIAQVCQRAGFRLRVEQEAIQMTTIVGLVAAGMGVSLLPSSVMELPRPDVKYVALPAAEPVPMSMIWHDTSPAPVLQHFLTIVSDVR